jgi:cytochrome P450
MRTVGEPLEHRGLRFAPGDLLALNLSSAGRDPAVFDDPGHLDPDRTNARSHVAFSNGVHHCLGAALARAELQEMLSVMLDLWSSVEADGPVVWKHARLPVWGAERLPIAVTRA